MAIGKSFNIINAAKVIKIKQLFESKEVLLCYNETDMELFVALNPNATNVRTAALLMTSTGIGTDTDGTYYSVASSTGIFVGDEIEISSGADAFLGVVRVTKVAATKIHYTKISGDFTVTSGDKITAHADTIVSGLRDFLVQSTDFANGMYFKHKSNTDTAVYNLTILTRGHNEKIKELEK